MPRAHRDRAAGIFHVTSHAVRSTELFADGIDRVAFLTELARVAWRYDWTVIGFCQMTTHYHLVVETPDDSLPLGMHDLNFRYATRFNSRHRLRGHVLEGRYYSSRITTEPHLLAVYRYVARNPVQAGLCDAPDQWPWGSYGALRVPSESFTFVDATRVIGCFGRHADTGLAQLQAFVDSAW
jgi:putative transposase